MKLLQHDGRGALRETVVPETYYVHVQGVPATSFHVVHNLGRHPATTFVDSAGREWLGEATHLSVNELIYEIDYAMSGELTCR